jgi:hypothetical protein
MTLNAIQINIKDSDVYAPDVPAQFGHEPDKLASAGASQL